MKLDKENVTNTLASKFDLINRAIFGGGQACVVIRSQPGVNAVRTA